MIVKNIILDVDITSFLDDFVSYGLTPIQLYLGYLMWPVIFMLVIGLVYRSTHNLGSVTASIFMVFGLFGTTNGFIQAPEISLFFYLIAVLSYAGLVLTVFIKKRFE